MPTVYKVLGQSAPSATTNTDLYTVPSATNTVCSTITVCNRGSASAQIRLAVRPAGAAITNAHYIIFNNVVAAADTLVLTIGITLNATDVVTVYASTADTSWNLYGSEIS